MKTFYEKREMDSSSCCSSRKTTLELAKLARNEFLIYSIVILIGISVKLTIFIKESSGMSFK
jgi:hypothetical protein